MTAKIAMHKFGLVGQTPERITKYRRSLAGLNNA